MEVIKMLVSDILEYIDKFAPFDTCEEFDNVGLLIGNVDNSVKNVLIALDLTSDVLNQAQKIDAELIITHHPVIFKPLKRIFSDDLIAQVVSSEISVICAHTNLDKAACGVNDALAEILELNDVKILENSSGYGRIGCLNKSLSCDSFIRYVSKKLNTLVKATCFNGCVETVAVLGGAGEFAWDDAKKSGADAFVTGESKHHILIEAKRNNFCFVDAGHFETEVLVCNALKNKLQHRFKDKVNFFVADQENPVCFCCGDNIWH